MPKIQNIGRQMSALLVACGLAGGVIATQHAASTGTPAYAASKKISFKHDIETIFTAHCAACHIANDFGGLHLGTYQGLLKGGTILPGPIIIAKHHARSYLWEITQPRAPWPGGNRMPLGGPYLSSSLEATIATWIDQGARNN